jgi:hypothetical protein
VLRRSLFDTIYFNSNCEIPVLSVEKDHRLLGIQDSFFLYLMGVIIVDGHESKSFLYKMNTIKFKDDTLIFYCNIDSIMLNQKYLLKR